ncbi:MAG: triose-phosphate isomerase [Eubacterium sp.]|nr:triose-phosphate isomerase [Eubacterium sp.]
MADRVKFIAGNWKMFKDIEGAKEFADAFLKLNRPAGIKVAVCAPFLQLTTLVDAFAGTGIGVGAQNVHFEDSGAFTGEIAVPMLKEVGVDYCIIGHSERREYFGETDETVNKKLKKLFNTSDIIPILCVGEKLDEREAGVQQDIVSAQLEKDLAGLDADTVKELVIAYEPIWAIGTGKTATPDQAQEMCAFIRGKLASMYDQATADAVIIQYGGSVKPGNAKDIIGKPDIDGALVGGASLDPEGFTSLIAAAAE